MNKNSLMLLLLAAGAYYLYTKNALVPGSTTANTGSNTTGNCPTGYTSVNGQCVAPPSTLACNPGYSYVNGSCVANPGTDTDPIGTLLSQI